MCSASGFSRGQTKEAIKIKAVEYEKSNGFWAAFYVPKREQIGYGLARSCTVNGSVGQLVLVCLNGALLHWCVENRL